MGVMIYVLIGFIMVYKSTYNWGAHPVAIPKKIGSTRVSGMDHISRFLTFYLFGGYQIHVIYGSN